MSKKKVQKSTLQLLGQMSGLGIVFALIICMAAFIGYTIDENFSTSPIFISAGIIAGFIAALLCIYQIVKKDYL